MGVPLADVDRVAVGRGAREAADPDRPPAPPTFSTTTAWPSSALIFSAMMRAATSVEPPGGNGTMIVMVRDG